MRFIVTFLPPILLPLLVALLFKRLNLQRWLTFVFTMLVLALYPLLITRFDSLFYPPDTGYPRCGMPIVGFTLGFWIICIPAALIIQLITNAIVWRWGNYLK